MKRKVVLHESSSIFVLLDALGRETGISLDSRLTMVATYGHRLSHYGGEEGNLEAVTAGRTAFCQAIRSFPGINLQWKSKVEDLVVDCSFVVRGRQYHLRIDYAPVTKDSSNERFVVERESQDELDGHPDGPFETWFEKPEAVFPTTSPTTKDSAMG